MKNDNYTKKSIVSKTILKDGFSNAEFENEIWMDILGYDGIYQVSDLGRIKSLKRYVEHPRHGSLLLQEKIRKQGFDKDRGFNITLSNNGINKARLVHQIVAETFIPNKHDFNCVRHKNGNKKDNRVSNLEWFTRIDASIDSNKKKIKTSKHNGVYFDKSKNKWRATINKKTLGTFNTEKKAINKRKQYCIENNIRFLYDM